MTGTAFGIGSPATQFGQSTAGMFPYSSYPIATPFALQASPYLQSLQHVPVYGMTAQPFGLQTQQYVQPLQQLLQGLPYQLAQLNHLQWQQLHGLQQLLGVLPQQLQQIQHLLQLLPQQIHQQQILAQQPPYGVQASPGFAGYGPWQPPIGGPSNWPAFGSIQQGMPAPGQSPTGVNVGFPTFAGQPGAVM
jgi:hypothetical protein